MLREKWKRGTRTVHWVPVSGPMKNDVGKVHNEEFARIYAHGYLTAYGQHELTMAHSMQEFPQYPLEMVRPIWENGLRHGLIDRENKVEPPKGFNDFLED